MYASFKRLISFYSFEDEADKHAARVILVIILGALLTCLFTLVGGLYWEEWTITSVGLTGIILQLIPLGLLAGGHLRASGFIVGLLALILVTIAATLGQGIHDIAIMAYPVIIIIASLILQRPGFFFLSSLTAISIGWLIYGEANGFFMRREILNPSWADFLIMLAILLVAAVTVYMQAKNMRRSLQQAQQEILHRKRMEEQLLHLGTHDMLTGVYNRHFFEEELARLGRSREFPISVVVADLDGLKSTNDSLGHGMGDELLRRASIVFSSAFREGDVLARIGGDEFAVLLPRSDMATAEQILLRVKERIAEHNTRYPDLPVQMSLGAATTEKGNLEQAFAIADQRMYEDKFSRKANTCKLSEEVVR